MHNSYNLVACGTSVCFYHCILRCAASEGPSNSVSMSLAYSLSMFSSASLGTRDGRILLSSVNLLALSLAKSRSGQKSWSTQQFCIRLWFAVSKLSHTHANGCLKWAYTCFHSSSHLSDFTRFLDFLPLSFASLFLADTGLNKTAYLGQGKRCLLI